VGAPSQFAIARRAQARHDALTCLAPFRPVLLSYLSRVILNQFEGGEVNFERALRSCRAVSRGFQVRDSKVLMRYDPARLRRTRSASYDVICLATQTNARKRSQFTATKPPESGRNDPGASDCLGFFFCGSVISGSDLADPRVWGLPATLSARPALRRPDSPTKGGKTKRTG
jgi:hypothetical protein